MKKHLIGFGLTLLASTAIADSFWNHNGSIMRLSDYGNERVFSYEHPSAKMQSAGVRSGDVLFNGVRRGDKYYGTAHVFSKYCNHSLPYKVSGNVYKGSKVVLSGTRPSYDTGYNKGCLPNGKMRKDTLVFTYISSE